MPADTLGHKDYLHAEIPLWFIATIVIVFAHRGLLVLQGIRRVAGVLDRLQ